MKYIMIETKFGQKFPVIFPNHFVHCEIAEVMTRLYGGKVVTAGDCNIECHSTTGKSTSLDLESDEEDFNLINRVDYFHGY